MKTPCASITSVLLWVLASTLVSRIVGFGRDIISPLIGDIYRRPKYRTPESGRKRANRSPGEPGLFSCRHWRLPPRQFEPALAQGHQTLDAGDVGALCRRQGIHNGLDGSEVLFGQPQ